MASTTADEPKISIKVFVQKEKNRVVFAEANHHFVDVLFSFMTFPMGAIVRLLATQDDKKFEALGSLKNLYQSLKDLPVNYFSTEEWKFMLLNPSSRSYVHCRKLKLNIDHTKPTKYFICEHRYNNCYRFSACNVARCSDCGMLMNREVCVKYSTSSADEDAVGSGVFVSELTTYIVTDDLRVMPCTPKCFIQLLMDVGISDASHLEEMTVDIGREQVLDLLRLALSFDSPLTYLVLPRTNSFLDLVHSEQGTFDQCTLIKEEVSTSPNPILQVSLQKSTGEVLFAEAGEDFVDFVFGFLAISLGTAIGTLMNGTSSLVCMDNIFRSISNMSVGRYFKSHDIQDVLLKPHFGHQCPTHNLIFPLRGAVFHPGRLYLSGFPRNVSNQCWDNCFLTHDIKGSEVCLANFNNQSNSEELFKKSGTFMVADDLVIKPLTSILTMDMLNKLKVPFNDVETHEVSIGLEEGIKMLEASLRSSSVLTIGLKHQLMKKLNPNS